LHASIPKIRALSFAGIERGEENGWKGRTEMIEPDRDKPVYSISVVAEMLNTNQQTLRIYEKEKLIIPKRTKKNTRLYSLHDVEELQRIIHLHQELGVNLAGVEVILNMLRRMEDMQSQMQRLFDILRDHYQSDIFAKDFTGQTSTGLVPLRRVQTIVTTRKKK
jgi:MerR family transcriptional regulator, heat shock protein HspR